MGNVIGGWSLALLLLFLCGACRGANDPWQRGEPWSFSITSSALDAMDRKTFEYQPPSCGPGGGVDDIWMIPAVVLAPVLVDVALLPVTGVHDLWVR